MRLMGRTKILNWLKDINFLQTVEVKYVMASVLTLIVYLILISFRSVDNNMLTSWRWVFAGVDPRKVLVFLALGIIIAYVLSRSSFLERYPVVSLFIISFISGMFFWREPEVIVDASRYFTQAKHLEVYGIGYFFKEWGRDIAAWTDLPLIPFFYGLIFKFLGESRIYIQVFTTLLFAGTVVLTYKIGRTLWSESVGFFGGLLLLGIPYLLTQVPLMLVDVPTMFFFTLAVYSFIKVLNRGNALEILFASIAILLAVLSKYSTWLMLSIMPVASLAFFFEGLAKARARGTYIGYIGFSRGTDISDVRPLRLRLIIYKSCAVALISIALTGIFALLKLDVVSAQLELLSSYQKPGLSRWGESFYSTFFFQIHPFITVSALYSAYIAYKKRDLRYVIISWLVILILLLRIERIRYIVMIFPMLTLMASYGLQQIKAIELRIFITLSAVISSLVIAVFAYLPFMQSISAINLMHAADYLTRAGIKDVEIVTLPLNNLRPMNPATTVPLFDLFSPQNITYHNDHKLLPPEDIDKSSLRFSWDYINPKYYIPKTGDSRIAAVLVIGESPGAISAGDIDKRLDGYRRVKVFKTATEFFRYQTTVSVYVRPTSAFISPQDSRSMDMRLLNEFIHDLRNGARR